MKAALLLLTMFQSADLFPVTAEEEKPAAKQTRREWYLVSESWCAACPAAKKRFLSLGWPKQNILTIDECEQKFGFRPPHVPFEFGDPNWKAEVNSVAETPAQPDGQAGGPIGSDERTKLIDHLLNDGIHAGRHTPAKLEAMSLEDLETLHTLEHNSGPKWYVQPKQTVRRRRGLFFDWGN